MGYVRERVLLLTFEDPQYEGLQVRVRSLSIGQVLDIIDPPTGEGGVRDQALLNAQRLADGLVSWNLEYPDGTPVPMTVDGILSQDRELITDINSARLREAVAVPAPLDQPSPDGGQSAEPSIPMEVLSAAPPS